MTCTCQKPMLSSDGTMCCRCGSATFYGLDELAEAIRPILSESERADAARFFEGMKVSKVAEVPSGKAISVPHTCEVSEGEPSYSKVRMLDAPQEEGFVVYDDSVGRLRVSSPDLSQENLTRCLLVCLQKKYPGIMLRDSDMEELAGMLRERLLQ